MKPNPIPQQDVLAWLAKNHPDLHAKAEIDRAWCWLPVDLRGDSNKAVRESLKAFGFRYAKRGHVLPSGKTGTWGHAAEKPIPFKRKGSDGARNPQRQERTETPAIDAGLAGEIDNALAEYGLA